MRVLAVDQGTTSTRALVFAPGQAPRVALQVHHSSTHPRTGWIEQDPLELLANVEAGFALAGPVDAAGLANQGESCLAWDRLTGQPLSRVIVWQDARTAAEVGAMKAAGLEDEIARRAGVPLDPYFSASKLAWVLRESPEAQAALRAGRLRLGTTDSFLLLRLTGVDATDPTTASRTSLLNLASLQWDPVLCNLFGVPIETLAPIRPTMGSFGAHRGVPILASIVDQQAALYGHGCREPGDMKMTFGTGGFALALVDRPPKAPRGGLTSTVAWSGPSETLYAVEGGLFDAGAAIEWAIRIGVVADTAELDMLVGQRAIANGVVFVPALSGLAAPQWSREAAGVWLGMSVTTTRTDMQKSLLEGIALQSACLLAAFTSDDAHRSPLAVDGGLSSNAYFLQFLADVSGLTIYRPELVEMTALGCAWMVAGSAFDTPNRRTIYEPRLDRADAAHHLATYARAVKHCLEWRAPS